MANSGAPLRAGPMVCAVLLNWNGADDTARCLRSLASLTYTSLMTVIVDNGSTDDSRRRFREDFCAVPLIENHANLGFARGCNVGIRWALERGADYVWLLNNDTQAEPGALAAMVAVAEQGARIGAVGGVLCDMEDPGRVHEWGGGWLGLRSGISCVHRRPRAQGRLTYICGGCLLLRRAALESVGLLDEGYFMYGEDADLGIRLRRSGWCLAIAADARVRHRHGPSLPALARIYLSSAGAARTLRKHSPWPLPAVVAGTAYRCARNAAVGRWRAVAANVSGAVDGWRAFARGAPCSLPAGSSAGQPAPNAGVGRGPDAPGAAEPR
jgi:GT2 family glycosyltransferase